MLHQQDRKARQEYLDILKNAADIFDKVIIAVAHNGAKAGFFLNFRDQKNETERTYFINIIDFNKMMKEINKVSCNEIDVLLHNGVKISGEKKRVHFKWNLEEFFENYNK